MVKKQESLFNFYKETVKECKLKYSCENVLVLMQVGSFYEIYDSGDYSLVNMDAVSSILNMIITKKDKSNIEVNEKNHLLIGFPCASLQKYIPKLLDENYIVIVVGQEKSKGREGKDVITRRISNTFTKGTFITDNIHNYISSNWLGCIYSEDKFSLGITFIDLACGITKVYQFYDDILEQIKRCIKIYSPKEIVVFSKNPDVSRETKIFESSNILIHFKDFDKSLNNVRAKNEFLSKIYISTGLLSPIEYCGLEFYPECSSSFVLAIKYAYNQNEKIVQFIKKPEVIIDSKFIYLNSNLLDKLNLPVLHDLLNKCCTSIGKREFKTRIMSPLNDLTEINRRLDLIDSIKQLDYTLMYSKFKSIKDLELLIKKIYLNQNNLNMVYYLIKYFMRSFEILNEILQSFPLGFYCELLNSKLVVDNVLGLLNRFFDNESTEVVNCILNEYNIPINNKDIQLIFDKINACVLVDSANLELNNDTFVVVFNNKKSNKDLLKKNVDLIDLNSLKLKISDFDTTLSNKTTIKLYNKDFNKELNALISKLDLLLQSHFAKFYSELFILDLTSILNFIKDFDVSLSVIISNDLYKYSRPNFNDEFTFSIKGIRHPIIEIMNKNVKYVDNDVDLRDGVLLYGINSIGKSSLIKSVGLNVILAQAGMYTPCESYNCGLIDKIFTRLPGSDDILSNNSSFTIEVADIRDFLDHSTRNSLILGDEICQSTETYSGISIITACLSLLSSKKCKFIISSHLHELTELGEIKELSNLEIKHLSILKDKNGRITFDRKLKDGPFHSLYGLEICKNLGLSKDFIDLALDIRKKLVKAGTLDVKKSKYNSKYFVKNECQTCGKRNTQFHVHHIIPQELADENGYIGNIHKNDEFNLTTLCEECHHKVHKYKLEIHGYTLTNEGVKLQFNKKYD